jgi:hypothetical protein
MDERYAWGVRHTSEVGWYGVGKPKKFSEGEAKEKAKQLNEKEPGKWEARRFDAK